MSHPDLAPPRRRRLGLRAALLTVAIVSALAITTASASAYESDFSGNVCSLCELVDYSPPWTNGGTHAWTFGSTSHVDNTPLAQLCIWMWLGNGWENNQGCVPNVVEGVEYYDGYGALAVGQAQSYGGGAVTIKSVAYG